MQKVADYFGNCVKIASGDSKVSIADLAQFTEFDPSDAKKYQTSVACVAVDAIVEEFSYEVKSFDRDFHDGGKVVFKDGSTLSLW